MRPDPGRSLAMASVLVVVLMVLTPLSVVIADVCEAGGRTGSRTVVDKFDSGQDTWTYTFTTDQVRKGATFTLYNNSYVDEATMIVRGLSRTANGKDYPVKPEVDFGDDGDIEWAFMETGFGKFGYQNRLFNDSWACTVSADASVENTDTTVRLPLNATVTSATLNIEGMFRFKEEFVVDGVKNDDEMGWSVSFVGDLNADTWPDFAEILTVDSEMTKYEPGDVLVLSSSKVDVELSSEPYSTNIAGIYSTKPGFIGSPHPFEDVKENEIPVAIVGIVPCKVTASNGAIKKGT